MIPASLDNYENAHRLLLARLFDDLLVAFDVKFWPEGGHLNKVSRGHTYRGETEVNSLSFFNPFSAAMETLEVSLKQNAGRLPIITITGPNGSEVTVLGDGQPEADIASVRAELHRVFTQPYLQELVAKI